MNEVIPITREEIIQMLNEVFQGKPDPMSLEDECIYECPACKHQMRVAASSMYMLADICPIGNRLERFPMIRCAVCNNDDSHWFHHIRKLGETKYKFVNVTPQTIGND